MNALRLTTLSLAVAATLAVAACGSLQIVDQVWAQGTEIGNGAAVQAPLLELASCDMSDPSCGATPPPPPEIDRLA